MTYDILRIEEVEEHLKKLVYKIDAEGKYTSPEIDGLMTDGHANYIVAAALEFSDTYANVIDFIDNPDDQEVKRNYETVISIIGELL